MIRRSFLLFVICSITFSLSGQVKWLHVDQLDSAVKAQPKPVFLELYTSWCTYCKKMNQEVFVNEEVIDILNEYYYAVKFDAESNAEVKFDGLHLSPSGNEPFHPLAMLLKPPNENFAPPLILFFDKDFELKERQNSYLSTKKLIKKLNNHIGF